MMNSKLILVLFLSFSFSYAQVKTKDGETIRMTQCVMKPVRDTLSYLKLFEINKSQYINKPFSYLLGQIRQITPKSHWAISPHKNKLIVKSSSFNFCGMKYSFKNAVTLHIVWQEVFPKSDVKYLQNKNEYYFTNEEKAFYSNKIVKDILVYK